MKAQYGDLIKFVLDGNPSHSGRGRVIVPNSHSYDVELLEDVKEYPKGSIVIIDSCEVLEVNHEKSFDNQPK
jgi:hypothetical protein